TGARRAAGPPNLPLNRWMPALEEIDLGQDIFCGEWKLGDKPKSLAPVSGLCKIALPWRFTSENLAGELRFRVRRTADGFDGLAFNLPLGDGTTLNCGFQESAGSPRLNALTLRGDRDPQYASPSEGLPFVGEVECTVSFQNDANHGSVVAKANN